MSKGQIVTQGTPEEVLTPANIEQVFNVRSQVRYNTIFKTVQLDF